MPACFQILASQSIPNTSLKILICILQLSHSFGLRQLIFFNFFQVDSDKTIELNCQAEGKPRPLVIWHKDGKLLNVTEEKFYLDSGALKIFRTHPVDSGMYECNVSNRIGYLTRSFKVEVESSILTIKVKELSKRQILAITLTSLAAFIFCILLLIALTYVFIQRNEHANLKVS